MIQGVPFSLHLSNNNYICLQVIQMLSKLIVSYVAEKEGCNFLNFSPTDFAYKQLVFSIPGQRDYH